MDYARSGAESERRPALAIKRASVQALRDLDEAWILSAFDEAGRALTRRHAREDGVPLGFDVLEIDLTKSGRTHLRATVTVTATSVELQNSCHAVRFTVAYASPATSGRPKERDVLLARAAGWIWMPSLGPLSGSFALRSPAGLGKDA